VKTLTVKQEAKENSWSRGRSERLRPRVQRRVQSAECKVQSADCKVHTLSNHCRKCRCRWEIEPGLGGFGGDCGQRPRPKNMPCANPCSSIHCSYPTLCLPRLLVLLVPVLLVPVLLVPVLPVPVLLSLYTQSSLRTRGPDGQDGPDALSSTLSDCLVFTACHQTDDRQANCTSHPHNPPLPFTPRPSLMRMRTPAAAAAVSAER
jgi:hypothetical protein